MGKKVNDGAKAPLPEVVSGAGESLPGAPLPDKQPEDQEHLQPVAVHVSSVGARFHRCGRAFSREPVRIPLDELSTDELQRLEDEPELICRYVLE